MSGLALVIALGAMGALGAGSRYLIVEWVAHRWRKPSPLAILFINVTGAFLLGFFTTAFAVPAQLNTRLLLGTGFLGGYTTFSTLSFETFSLGRRGDTLYAWLNVMGSLGAGLLAAALGMLLGARIG